MQNMGFRDVNIYISVRKKIFFLIIVIFIQSYIKIYSEIKYLDKDQENKIGHSIVRND